jgi:small-conductance mechanosensitive channel
LLMAAQRTSGLLREPAPFVLQTALDDFYIRYELNVATGDPLKMRRAYSELHANIQDAFNEYGVQIMVPHYEADRPGPTLVPKERWFASPAKNPPKSSDGLKSA